jgi:hypothetical protein
MISILVRERLEATFIFVVLYLIFIKLDALNIVTKR